MIQFLNINPYLQLFVQIIQLIKLKKRQREELDLEEDLDLIRMFGMTMQIFFRILQNCCSS